MLVLLVAGMVDLMLVGVVGFVKDLIGRTLGGKLVEEACEVDILGERCKGSDKLGLWPRCCCCCCCCCSGILGLRGGCGLGLLLVRRG